MLHVSEHFRFKKSFPFFSRTVKISNEKKEPLFFAQRKQKEILIIDQNDPLKTILKLKPIFMIGEANIEDTQGVLIARIKREWTLFNTKWNVVDSKNNFLIRIEDKPFSIPRTIVFYSGSNKILGEYFMVKYFHYRMEILTSDLDPRLFVALSALLISPYWYDFVSS